MICIEKKAGGWQTLPSSIQIFKLSNRSSLSQWPQNCNNTNLHRTLYFCHLFCIATIFFYNWQGHVTGSYKEPYLYKKRMWRHRPVIQPFLGKRINNRRREVTFLLVRFLFLFFQKFRLRYPEIFRGEWNSIQVSLHFPEKRGNFHSHNQIVSNSISYQEFSWANLSNTRHLFT